MNTKQFPAMAAILAVFALTPTILSAAAPPAKLVEAPLVKNLKDLKSLNRRIVAMAEPSAAATVSLMSKGGGGAGSGVVVSEDGIILTAAHVIAAMGNEFMVIFPDGTRRNAQALGADYDRDAAMARITENGSYPHVELGDSEELARNEWCIALGHPGGFDPTRTPPVRLGRLLRKGTFLITDSAVVGGDSGGPLFDADGHLIGIHSNIGASLMANRHVPVSVYQKNWESMKDGKRTGTRFAKKPGPSDPERPVVGVHLGETAEDGGVEVLGVMNDSPAAKAGLRTGDIITKINDKDVTGRDELMNAVSRFKPGKKIKVAFRRDGATEETEIKLARLGDLMMESPRKKAEEKAEEEEKDKDHDKDHDKDALDRFLDKQFNPENGKIRLELSPEDIERFGGIEKIMERIKERTGAMGAEGLRKKPAADEDEKEEAQLDATPKEEAKEKDTPEDPGRAELKKRLADAMKSGELQLTPEQLGQFGGMEKLRELLRELAKDIDPKAQLQLRTPGVAADPFYSASAKAITPLTRKAAASTVAVHLDGKQVALGTVITKHHWIITKDTETQDGEVTVEVGGSQIPAKLVKRFPKRDLALFQVEAEGLKPVRWRNAGKDIPVGSFLTSASPEGTPLGFGLLSVKTRALAGIGFLGISTSEAEQGVLIKSTVARSAATKAGVKAGDIITAANGKPCESPVAFGQRIRGLRAGQTITLSILRGDEELEIEVTLGERKMSNDTPRFRRMNEMSGDLSERIDGFPMALQHDIPLEPSECGGPLLDLSGRCVGINVSRAGRVKTFAIPASDLRELLADVAPAKRTAARRATPAPLDRERQELLDALDDLQERIREIEDRVRKLPSN